MECYVWVFFSILSTTQVSRRSPCHTQRIDALLVRLASGPSPIASGPVLRRAEGFVQISVRLLKTTQGEPRSVRFGFRLEGCAVARGRPRGPRNKDHGCLEALGCPERPIRVQLPASRTRSFQPKTSWEVQELNPQWVTKQQHPASKPTGQPEALSCARLSTSEALNSIAHDRGSELSSIHSELSSIHQGSS